MKDPILIIQKRVIRAMTFYDTGTYLPNVNFVDLEISMILGGP